MRKEMQKMRRVNRLLMGASKLPGRGKVRVMQSSVYTWENQIRYAGYSQLEPVIQMFYETKCRDTGDVLEVILLCTERALKEECILSMQRSIENESENAFSKEVQLALAEGNIVSAESPVSTQKTYTAVDYLIHRIKYYMTGASSDLGEEKIGCRLLEDTKNKQYIYTFPENCENGTEALRIVLIRLNENDPVDGLKTAFEYLKSNREEGAFWIDTHGGFREISMIMTSLVSLLRVEDIVPEKVLGVLFDEKENCIVEQMQMIDINLFVAGMEEFINHGSTEILKQYYRRYYGENLPRRMGRWLDTMNKISDGTRLCDPKLLQSGIRELKSICGKYDRGTEIEKEDGQVEDRYMEIFADYIRKDYGDLLNRISDLKIIKRCHKKKMYQQALTFIEACMPKYLAGNRLCYFDVSDEKYNEWKKGSNKSHEEEKDKETFLFNRYIGFMFTDYKSEDKKSWNNTTILNKLETLEDVDITWPSDMKYDTCLNGLPEEERSVNLKKLEHVLILHSLLKHSRNLYNHASVENGRPQIEQVDRAIELYISMIEDMEKVVALHKQ